MVLDHIAAASNVSFRPGKGDFYFAKTEWTGFPLWLVKPTTYMNNSGLAIKQLFNLLQPDQPEKLVIYDDFHLPFGQLRFRARGSSGGHNGIKSIISELNSEVFDRLRIGIGAADNDAIDHVLSVFTEEENAVLPDILKLAADGIGLWLQSGIEPAMNIYNRRLISAEDAKEDAGGSADEENTPSSVWLQYADRPVSDVIAADPNKKNILLTHIKTILSRFKTWTK